MKFILSILDWIKHNIVLGVFLVIAVSFNIFQWNRKPKTVQPDCSYFQKQNDQLVSALIEVRKQMNDISPDTNTHDARHTAYIDTIPKRRRTAPAMKQNPFTHLKLYLDSAIRVNRVQKKSI